MKKIADWSDRVGADFCRHPSHNPPTMIVLEPGIYEHECHGCGQKQVVTIPPKASL